MLVVGCSHSVVSTDDVTTTKVNGRYSVTLSIIQGRKIKKMDISGESDPYVKVTFAGQSKRVRFSLQLVLQWIPSCIVHPPKSLHF